MRTDSYKYSSKPPSKQGERLYTLAHLVAQARRQIASDPRHAHQHKAILRAFLRVQSHQGAITG